MCKNILINDLRRNLKKCVSICGWVIYKEKCLYLRDYSGDVQLINVKESLRYRDVIEVEGTYSENGSFDVFKLTILNRNTYIDEQMLSSKQSNYFKYSYLYNLQPERISLIKKMNDIESCVRRFLMENDFLEVKVPVLWTSVREYGDKEWRATIKDGEGWLEYVLPQSPEILSLLNAIGGIQKNFTFGKCFRKENEQRADSVVEFTQLVITAAFYNIESAKNLLEELFKTLISSCDSVGLNDIRFSSIPFEDSIYYYDTDKPDLRFREVSYVTISCDEKFYKVAFIPIDMNEEQFNKVKRLFVRHIKKGDGFIYQLLENQNIEFLKGVSSEFLRKKFSCESKIIIMGVDCESQLFLNILQGCIEFIYKLKQIVVPKYCFTWVERMPLVKDRNIANTQHCIFSTIEEGALENTNDEKQYYVENIDLVLNGVELASGGVRENKSERFIRLLKYHGISDIDETYGYYINALDSGAPKCFSISLGWERILYLVTHSNYIQEVINFPKDCNGYCQLTKMPIYIQGDKK